MAPGEIPRLLTLCAWLAAWGLATAALLMLAPSPYALPIGLGSGAVLLAGLGGYRPLAALLWRGVVGVVEAGRGDGEDGEG